MGCRQSSVSLDNHDGRVRRPLRPRVAGITFRPFQRCQLLRCEVLVGKRIALWPRVAGITFRPRRPRAAGIALRPLRPRVPGVSLVSLIAFRPFQRFQLLRREVIVCERLALFALLPRFSLFSLRPLRPLRTGIALFSLRPRRPRAAGIALCTVGYGSDRVSVCENGRYAARLCSRYFRNSIHSEIGGRYSSLWLIILCVPLVCFHNRNVCGAAHQASAVSRPVFKRLKVRTAATGSVHDVKRVISVCVCDRHTMTAGNGGNAGRGRISIFSV